MLVFSEEQKQAIIQIAIFCYNNIQNDYDFKNHQDSIFPHEVSALYASLFSQDTDEYIADKISNIFQKYYIWISNERSMDIALWTVDGSMDISEIKEQLINAEKMMEDFKLNGTSVELYVAAFVNLYKTSMALYDKIYLELMSDPAKCFKIAARLRNELVSLSEIGLHPKCQYGSVLNNLFKIALTEFIKHSHKAITQYSSDNNQEALNIICQVYEARIKQLANVSAEANEDAKRMGLHMLKCLKVLIAYCKYNILLADQDIPDFVLFTKACTLLNAMRDNFTIVGVDAILDFQHHYNLWREQSRAWVLNAYLPSQPAISDLVVSDLNAKSYEKSTLILCGMWFMKESMRMQPDEGTQQAARMSLHEFFDMTIANKSCSSPDPLADILKEKFKFLFLAEQYQTEAELAELLKELGSWQASYTGKYLKMVLDCKLKLEMKYANRLRYEDLRDYYDFVVLNTVDNPMAALGIWCYEDTLHIQAHDIKLAESISNLLDALRSDWRRQNYTSAYLYDANNAIKADEYINHPNPRINPSCYRISPTISIIDPVTNDHFNDDLVNDFIDEEDDFNYATLSDSPASDCSTTFSTSPDGNDVQEDENLPSSECTYNSISRPSTPTPFSA